MKDLGHIKTRLIRTSVRTTPKGTSTRGTWCLAALSVLLFSFSIFAQVPVTAIKDQGDVGFCWAYSATAQLESEYLLETGKKIDLSEEYIGFHALYLQILEQAPLYFTELAKTPETPESQKSKSALNRLWKMIAPLLFVRPQEGAPHLKQAFEMIEQFGVVSETEFSYKFKKSLFGKSISGRFKRFINTVLRDPKQNAYYRIPNSDGSLSSKPDPLKLKKALAAVFTGEWVSPELPYLQKYSECISCKLIQATQKAVSFSKNNLRFDNNHYEYLEIKNVDQSKEALALIDQAIRNRQGVQLGFTLYGDFESDANKGVFKPKTCTQVGDLACAPQGGHAVYITDYKEGRIKIKNSWGPERGYKGYQWVEIAYLNQGFNQNPTSGSWSILFRKRK